MASPGRIKMLSIEVDGHFHGSSDVPRPWVARIDGTDPKYGLARHFVQKLNDWEHAKKAWSGNLYGVVATFPLREGNLYEVSRLRGSSSKRHVAREFLRVELGKYIKLEPLEALALAERHDGPVTVLRVDDTDDRPWVAEITGLGMPRVLGFVVLAGQRCYRLRHGRVYEVRDIVGESERRRLIGAGPALCTLSQSEAATWLAAQ